MATILWAAILSSTKLAHLVRVAAEGGRGAEVVVVDVEASAVAEDDREAEVVAAGAVEAGIGTAVIAVAAVIAAGNSFQ